MHHPDAEDDLILPDPEEAPTAGLRPIEWPFGRWETVALAALYVLPFVISELVKP